MGVLEKVKDVAEQCIDKARELMKDSVIMECHENGSFDFNMVIKKVEIAMAVEQSKSGDAKMD